MSIADKLQLVLDYEFYALSKESCRLLKDQIAEVRDLEIQAAKNPTIQEIPYSPPVWHHIPRHPTLAECEEAGRSPMNYFISPAKYGLPLPSPQELARFEAFMHGHEWYPGNFIEADGLYDTKFVRDLFGVWCARGGLPTVWTDD